MKLIHGKFYKRCLISLTAIALMISSIPGKILCVDKDDYVAIEAANSDCCDNLDVTVSRKVSKTFPQKAFSSGKNNFSPCEDIPISIGFVGIFKKLNRVNPTSLVSNPIIPITINSSNFPEYKYQSASELVTIANPSLTSLRTIIILT